MSTLAIEARAKKIWIDEENLWLLLSDGRQLSVPLVYFPRLLKATPKQRQHFDVSGDGIGIHWDELDEDISVEGLLLGIRDTTKSRL
jgi:hypothetical protein